MGRWPRRLSLLAAGLALSGTAMSEAARAAEESAALALIGVNAREGNIEVVGGALALEAGTFLGEMVIDRQGASGAVSSRQSREVTLATGEEADIARVGVSYTPGDRLTVTVILKREGIVVSQASLSTAEN